MYSTDIILQADCKFIHTKFTVGLHLKSQFGQENSALCPLVKEAAEVLVNFSLIPGSLDVVLVPLQPN